MWPLQDAFGRRLTASSLAVTLGASLAGLALFTLRARTTSVSALSVLTRAELNGIAVLVVVGLAAAWGLWGRRGSRLLSDLTVAATATFMSGSLVLALSGTPWGLWGLVGDQRFRTEAVTRFQYSLASADYGYRGLPSHYPPLLAWLEARLGLLVGLPGWQMVKYGQIVLALLVPVLAYLLWRRLVDAPRAAAVVGVTSLFNADAYKPDEWLVLAVLIPWWIDAFRGHRARGVRPWPAWVHGIVAGLLLTTFTFYFIPIAVATIAGVGLDIARRRPWRQDMLRYVVIVTVGLLAAAWYWFPLAMLRLRGLPADSLQLRWFFDMLADVHVLPDDVVASLLALVGLLYLMVAAPRRPASEGLLLVGVGGYVVIGAGLLSATLNHPVLAFKAEPLTLQVLLAGGALAPFELASFAARWSGERPGVLPLLYRGVLGALAVSMLAGMLHFVQNFALGSPILAAHSQPLPDGSLPEDTQVRRTASEAGNHASVLQVRKALGAATTPSSVVVTSVVDVYATTPFHLFTAVASIYSNPFGQYERRVRLLERLAATRNPGRFTELARHNPFDAIDGFVLLRQGNRYTALLGVDGFPEKTGGVKVHFHRRQFAASDWRVTEFPDVVVITAR